MTKPKQMPTGTPFLTFLVLSLFWLAVVPWPDPPRTLEVWVNYANDIWAEVGGLPREVEDGTILESIYGDKDTLVYGYEVPEEADFRVISDPDKAEFLRQVLCQKAKYQWRWLRDDGLELAHVYRFKGERYRVPLDCEKWLEGEDESSSIEASEST